MSEFQRLMRRADTLRRGENNPYRSAWWTGYIRGLRRAHHGEAFGTAAEHALFLAAADDEHPERRALGQGYQAGLTLTAASPEGTE